MLVTGGWVLGFHSCAKLNRDKPGQTGTGQPHPPAERPSGREGLLTLLKRDGIRFMHFRLVMAWRLGIPARAYFLGLAFERFCNFIFFGARIAEGIGHPASVRKSTGEGT